ncbi:MAG: asparaginase [Chloroflexi bacterium]|nr:asparaginase [Chloroflexota bacterium]
MAAFGHIPLVEVSRGQIVESVHYGSLNLSQADGKVLLSLGDQISPFFLRSSAKPFQLLAFLERGGIRHYSLLPQEIAVMCASHSGTPAHIKVLKALQKKVGIDESLLQCGVHPPYHKASADELIKNGITLRPNHNNCSGKHTGMLAFAKMTGAPLGSYLENSHPVQKAILKTFAEMCEVQVESVELGVDGCTAPVFAVPLRNAALGYAKLCQPDHLAENRAASCRVITSAMSAHADMVAGPKRFDTDGMFAGKGAFISKLGAEGYRGVGILPGKASGISCGLGLTIKISDGDATYRATSVIAMAVLKALGILDDGQIDVLKQYDNRPVTNWRGVEIGEIRPSKDLMAALTEFTV